MNIIHSPKKYREKILASYISYSYGDAHNRDTVSGLLGDDLKSNRRFFHANYRKHLPKKKDAPILELGPGMGQFLHFLQDEGYSSIRGVDGSKEVVKLCSDNGFTVDYTEDMIAFFRKQDDETFACIIANDILEHFDKEELFVLMEEIKRTLNKEGIIIAKVPNASACFVGANSRYSDLTHELSFTENSIQQLCSAIGFQSVTTIAPHLFCFYFNPLNYIGWTASTLLKYMQISIHRLNGNFDVRIVSGNILFIAKK